MGGQWWDRKEFCSEIYISHKSPISRSLPISITNATLFPSPVKVFQKLAVEQMTNKDAKKGFVHNYPFCPMCPGRLCMNHMSPTVSAMLSTYFVPRTRLGSGDIRCMRHGHSPQRVPMERTTVSRPEAPSFGAGQSLVISAPSPCEKLGHFSWQPETWGRWFRRMKKRASLWLQMGKMSLQRTQNWVLQG